MSPYPTIIVILATLLIMGGLGVYSGADSESISALILWIGAPYLCCCRLAFTRRRDGFFVFLNTLLSGGVVTSFYGAIAIQNMQAKASDHEMMNCGPPIIEFAVTLLQWLHVLLVFLALKCLPREKASQAGRQ